MLSGYQVIMYFQSTVRNIGLFTSICVAALTAANVYQPRTRGARFGLVAIYLASTIFLACAVFVNIQMLRDYEKSIASIDASERTRSTINFANWKILPQTVLVAQGLLAVVLVMSIWRRRRQIIKL